MYIIAFSFLSLIKFRAARSSGRASCVQIAEVFADAACMLHLHLRISIEMLARRGVWVFTIAAFVVLPIQVRPNSADTTSSAMPGLCSARNDNRRLSIIRDDILSKLSPFLPFDSTSQQWSGGQEGARNGSRNVDPALLSAYEALSQVLSEEDSAEPTGCDRGRGTPAFAKRISLFFPVNHSVFYAPLEKQRKDEGNLHCKLKLDS